MSKDFLHIITKVIIINNTKIVNAENEDHKRKVRQRF